MLRILYVSDGQRIIEFAHTQEQRRLALKPGQDIVFLQGRIIEAQLQSHRLSYVNCQFQRYVPQKGTYQGTYQGAPHNSLATNSEAIHGISPPHNG